MSSGYLQHFWAVYMRSVREHRHLRESMGHKQFGQMMLTAWMDRSTGGRYRLGSLRHTASEPSVVESDYVRQRPRSRSLPGKFL